MSAMQEQLLTLLSGATDAGTRIYPNASPDKPARPYLVYTRASSNSENVLGGYGGIMNTRIQIDAYADSYAAAQALASQVDALMRAWALQNVSYPAIDQYEPETRLHRVILEYSVWHG